MPVRSHTSLIVMSFRRCAWTIQPSSSSSEGTSDDLLDSSLTVFRRAGARAGARGLADDQVEEGELADIGVSKNCLVTAESH